MFKKRYKLRAKDTDRTGVVDYWSLISNSGMKWREKMCKIRLKGSTRILNNISFNLLCLCSILERYLHGWWTVFCLMANYLHLQTPWLKLLQSCYDNSLESINSLGLFHRLYLCEIATAKQVSLVYCAMTRFSDDVTLRPNHQPFSSQEVRKIKL